MRWWIAVLFALSLAGCEDDTGQNGVNDPCDGSDDDAVGRICVWATPSDLRALHDDPQNRDLEIDAAVTIGGQRFEDAELEVHGGWSRRYDKLSFRLKFDDPEETLIDLYGDGPEPVERVVLNASFIDRSFARQKLVMDLTTAEGGLAPRVSHIQLYLNGEWHGLYLTIERIDESFLTRHDLLHDGGEDDEHHGPFLFKAESLAADWDAAPSHWLEGMDVVMGDPGDAEEDLTRFIGGLWALGYPHPTVGEAYFSAVSMRMAISDWTAWHLVHSFAANVDTFWKNYYLFHDPNAADDRYRIIMWDADATFGLSWDGEMAATSDLRTPYGRVNQYAGRYFGVAAIVGDYLIQYDDALDTRLSPASLEGRLDAFADTIRPFAVRDLARWQPTRNYDDEVDALRGYFSQRHTIMRDVIDNALAVP